MSVCSVLYVVDVPLVPPEVPRLGEADTTQDTRVGLFSGMGALVLRPRRRVPEAEGTEATSVGLGAGVDAQVDGEAGRVGVELVADRTL